MEKKTTHLLILVLAMVGIFVAGALFDTDHTVTLHKQTTQGETK